MRLKSLTAAALLAGLSATSSWADPAEIRNVSVVREASGYAFSVTVAHPDTGWDHYASAWRITDMDGNLIAERELQHPHVNEQPFTRNLSGVQLPPNVNRVKVQAKCSRDGWNPTSVVIDVN